MVDPAWSVALPETVAWPMRATPRDTEFVLATPQIPARVVVYSYADLRADGRPKLDPGTE
jgi:hypothetical protein